MNREMRVFGLRHGAPKKKSYRLISLLREDCHRHESLPRVGTGIDEVFACFQKLEQDLKKGALVSYDLQKARIRRLPF